jgi:hypothetical protein
MGLLASIRSAASNLLQGTRTLANDVVLPNKLMAARMDLLGLQSKLAKLERSSDVFLTRTGQRVESRDVTQLRMQVMAKTQQVAQLSNQVEARQQEQRDARAQLYRNFR